jgi:hypothetical protein
MNANDGSSNFSSGMSANTSSLQNPYMHLGFPSNKFKRRAIRKLNFIHCRSCDEFLMDLKGDKPPHFADGVFIHCRVAREIDQQFCDPISFAEALLSQIQKSSLGHLLSRLLQAFESIERRIVQLPSPAIRRR